MKDPNIKLNREEWGKWIGSRPEMIQEMARKFPPDTLFRMKSTGHIVRPTAYNEDGTLTVYVGPEYNFVFFARNVFGVKQEDLEEYEEEASDES